MSTLVALSRTIELASVWAIVPGYDVPCGLAYFLVADARPTGNALQSAPNEIIPNAQIVRKVTTDPLSANEGWSAVG